LGEEDVTTSEGVDTAMAVMQQAEERKRDMEKMIKSESSWGKRRRSHDAGPHGQHFTPASFRKV